MKITCKEPGCGTVFDTAERDTAEKLFEDHKARFHGNHQERVERLAKAAKSMAFAMVNGAAPKRKDARELVTMASQMLNEPIPEMPEEDEKAPAEKDAVPNPGGEGTDSFQAGATLNKKAKK